MRGRWLLHPMVRPVLLGLCCLPALQLLWGAITDGLGPNPGEALIRGTGDWTLRWLCVALAVTPVRVGLAIPFLARWRRTLGLTVFAYAVLHGLCYAWLDMGFEWTDLASDITKRPFLLVGFLGLTILTLLAATSWNGAVSWLGGRRWQMLHRSVYLVAGLAVLHFFWMRAGKQNFAEVAVYGAILGALLAWRLQHRIRAGARGASGLRSTRVDE